MYYPGIFTKRLRQTTEISARMVGVPAEIRAKRLPNTSVERYRYISLLGGRVRNLKCKYGSTNLFIYGLLWGTL
jgi:hypothetical protein